MRMIGRIGIAGVVIGLAACGGCRRQEDVPMPPPTTRAATQPAPKPPTTQYVDVIRASYPAFPATQPLGVPVDLVDAGHFVLPDPVHLGLRGDLWITRDDAPPLEIALKTAADDQIHIVPRPVEFVQWATDEDSGKIYPRLVVRDGSSESGATMAPAPATTAPAAKETASTAPSSRPSGAGPAAGSFVWLDRDQRRPTTAGRNYRWRDAIYMNEQVVVPTDRGVSVFTFSPQFKEDYHDIVQQPGHSVPRVLLDGRGFLAFAPWEQMQYGGDGAVRYVEGQWVELKTNTAEPARSWPLKLVHVVPLLDGSVLQLYREQPGGPVKLRLGVLDSANIDEKRIQQLVEQLSDEDPKKRQAAFDELQQYGTGSWPILEKLADDQPPEARSRVQQLLANRKEPTLGGRKPLDGVMQLADRFADGGVLLYLPAGVSIPQQIPDRPPEIVKPAWVSLRPGRPIELLDPVLTKDAQPGKQHFFAFGEEWVVSDTTEGPRRLAGNHLEPLLNKDEAAFDYVVGFDSRGRWLFKKSADAPQTLVLDPTLPDTTPKLPVWQMWVEKGSVGWTKNSDFPVIKRGGAWALHEDGWQPVDNAKDPMVTSLPIRPRPRPLVARAASGPATTRTAAATAPTTNVAAATTAPGAGGAGPVTRPAEPILVDSDGRQYFDGKQSLRVVDRDGKEIVWPLPPNAVGSRKPTLLRTADGRLFLFNEPGRIVRIAATTGAGAAEPFKVEAVFTHRIPQSDDIQRIWLDPAGRIDIAYEHDRLAICFPQGRLPREMQVLIPASELDDPKK